MISDLAFAADFLDGLTNPERGIAVNESYATRLAELTRRFPDALGQLTKGAPEEDRDAALDLLGTHGWLWYLGHRSERGTTPEAIVGQLFDSTDDVVVRLRVVEIAATNPRLATRLEELRPEEPLPITEFPEPALRNLLSRAVHAQEDPTPAIQLVGLLLQVGNPVSIEACRSLAAHHWEHRATIRDTVRAYIAAGGADDEAAVDWQVRLGITPDHGDPSDFSDR